MRHASQGGWLQVALDVEGGEAVLSVADDGPGLPEDMRHNPFRRFQKPLHRNSEGVGLGLSIVQTLVLQQGGQVSADDRPGGGTVFTIRLALV